MLKSTFAFLTIIILSFLVVIATPQAQQVLQWILAGHPWASQTLTDVFSGGEAGSTIRSLLALLIIPIGVGLVPAIIYWIARRGWFPYFLHVVWVVWLLQTSALVIQGKVG